MSEEERNESSKELPIVIEYGEPEPAERMVSLASVISVVAAVCIAHFLIVVGGLSGARGYAKLQAAGEWFDSIWQQTVGFNSSA